MKKIVTLFAVLSLTLMSCKKTQLSNCGMATSTKIIVYPKGQVVYRVWIESETSGIVKRADVTSLIYLEAKENGYACLENVSAW